MARHLVVNFSNPLAYRELFPIVDTLLDRGEDVSLLAPRRETSFYRVGWARAYYLPDLSQMDFYCYAFGLKSKVKSIKNLEKFRWVDEDAVRYDDFDLFWGINGWIDDIHFLRKYPQYGDRYVLVPHLKPGYPDFRLRLGRHDRYFGWPHFDWLYEARRKSFDGVANYVLYMKAKHLAPEGLVPSRAEPLTDESLNNMRQAEIRAQEDFFEPLIGLVLGKLKKPLIIKSIAFSHLFQAGEEKTVTRNIVDGICSRLGLDPSRILVTDEYSGYYYKNAWCILSHGSSEVTEAMMLNDRIAVLAFPNRRRSDTLQWFNGKLRDFDDLERALSSGRFGDVRATEVYKRLRHVFDGKCTERTVEFALEYLRSPSRLSRDIKSAYYRVWPESRRKVAALLRPFLERIA